MKFISEKAASKAMPEKMIAYISNPEKCVPSENGILMRTIGLDDSRSYSRQFQDTAELSGNPYTNASRKYYHFKYTVSPEDYAPERGITRIMPEQLLDETETLALDKFHGYQCIITIQYHGNGLSGEKCNKKHLHAHLLVNASSYIPGQHKLFLQYRDLDDLRDYAYESGKKYDLSEGYWREEAKEKRKRQEKIYDKPIHISLGERELIQKYGAAFGDYAWKEQCRIAIDEAREETTSLELFILYLLEAFQVRGRLEEDGEILFRVSGHQNYISGQKLGTDYIMPAILSSLQDTKNTADFYAPAKSGWQLHQMDIVRIARKLDANTPAEFELLVRQEGKKCGNAKREYQLARKAYNRALQGGTEDAITDAERDMQEKKDLFENQKAYYVSCTKALESVQRIHAANALYHSDLPPSERFISEPALGRSKEEAEKERLHQWADLRKWSDEATEKAAIEPNQTQAEDLRLWASVMEAYGCRLRITEKTISIQHPDAAAAVRSNRLGGAYTKEEIIYGISLQRARNNRARGRTYSRPGPAAPERSRGDSR